MTGGGQQRSDQVHLECDSITIVVIIVLASSTKIIMISLSLREAFKKKITTKHMENSISLGGRGSAGGHFPYVITKDFKCTESHFEHF